MQINTASTSWNLPYTIKSVERRLDYGLVLLNDYYSSTQLDPVVREKISNSIQSFASARQSFLMNPGFWVSRRVEDLTRVIMEEAKAEIYPFDTDSQKRLESELLKTVRLASAIHKSNLNREIPKVSFSLDQKKEIQKFILLANERIVIPIFRDVYWSLLSPYTIHEAPSNVEIDQVKKLKSEQFSNDEISKQISNLNNHLFSFLHEGIYSSENMHRWISEDVIEYIFNSNMLKL